MMNDKKVILHIDMDAFFASVEQHLNPRLINKPVLVTGNHSASTVVAACSYEARKYGISSGTPLATALKACPWAIVVKGNPIIYSEVSEKMFHTLFRFSPDVECSSIDEAYMDITNTSKFFNGADNTARMIKESIMKETGLNCSIGIAPNKLMAKLASNSIKPNGIRRIYPEQINDIMMDLPVRKLCGIGKKTGERLIQMGIFTCRQLSSFPVKELQKVFGINGIRLHYMGKGMGDTYVIPPEEEAPQKSVGHTHSLSTPTFKTEKLKALLMILSEKVAVRLRELEKGACQITLTIRFYPFSTMTTTHRLDHCTDDGSAIYSCACTLMDKQMPLCAPVRMLGVSCSRLGIYSFQQDLFSQPPKNRSLNSTIDRIQDRFGTGKIKRCSMLLYCGKNIYSLSNTKTTITPTFKHR